MRAQEALSRRAAESAQSPRGLDAEPEPSVAGRLGGGFTSTLVWVEDVAAVIARCRRPPQEEVPGDRRIKTASCGRLRSPYSYGFSSPATPSRVCRRPLVRLHVTSSLLGIEDSPPIGIQEALSRRAAKSAQSPRGLEQK